MIVFHFRLWAWFVLVCVGAEAGGVPVWDLGYSNAGGSEEVSIAAVDGVALELEKREEAGVTSWRLSGDHRFLDTQARWSPIYGIVRIADGIGTGAKAKWVGRVSVWRTFAQAETKEKPADSLDAFVGVRRDEDAVAVVVWLEQGRPASALAFSLPVSKGLNRFNQILFPLGEGGLSRAGQPVVLMWQKGGFLKAKPRYAEADAQRVFIAAMRDDEAELGRLLEKPSLAKQRDERGLTPLHYAAEAGAEGAVARLLAAGVSVRARAKSDESALHWAAAKGRAAIVEQLLAAKAFSDLTDERGWTPFMYACANGHSEIARRFLTLKSVDVGRVDRAGNSAATLALNAGYADIVRALLERKRGVLNFADAQMTRVLVTQVAQGREDMVRLMLERETRVDVVVRGRTVLLAAAARGSLPLVELLLAAGAGVDQAGEGGVTPLMVASRKGSVEIVARLLAAGASARSQSALGMTALHEAILGNSVEAARLLMEAGALMEASEDVNSPEPLALALIVNARAVLPMLEDRGARLDWRRAGAEYALFLALAADRETLLRRALEDGWPAETKLNGWSAAGLAKFYGAVRCEAVLREAGARMAETDVPRPVGAKELDALPRPLRVSQPVDPRDPDEIFPETKVWVDFILSPEGAVLFPRVAESVDARLAVAALESVAGWQFSPPLKDGQPATGRFLLPMVFASSRERAFEEKWVDVPPKVKFVERPEYSAALQASGIAGHVVLAAEVTPEGQVENARAIESTNPLLDAEAVRVFKKWQFTPAMRDGEPVRVRIRQVISFSIAP